MTTVEIARLRALPGLARQPLPWDKVLAGALKLLLWLELLLGLPVAALFFAAAHWGHREDVATALGHAAYGFLVPPGFAVLLALGSALSQARSPMRDWRAQVLAELKAGRGAVTTHRPLAAHPVLDGDNDTPHMLLRLAQDRWLCLAAQDWSAALPGFAPTDTLTLCALPKTKVLVSLQFTGPPIPVLDLVRTDHVWRNDDLPFDQPFGKRGLPDELRRQLDRR